MFRAAGLAEKQQRIKLQARFEEKVNVNTNDGPRA